VRKILPTIAACVVVTAWFLGPLALAGNAGTPHEALPAETLQMLKLAALFVRTLAAHYAIEGAGQGPAVRGRYHWQPPKTFTVRLNPR